MVVVQKKRYQCAKQIRERWPKEEQPILVAMTANAMKEDRELYMQVMDDCLYKPINMNKVRSLLDKWEAHMCVGPPVETETRRESKKRKTRTEEAEKG